MNTNQGFASSFWIPWGKAAVYIVMIVFAAAGVLSLISDPVSVFQAIFRFLF